MDSDEEPNNENVRRTRSGKIVRTPPVRNSAPKRSRKKPVLMEVEPSDDDDDKLHAELPEQILSEGEAVQTVALKAYVDDESGDSLIGALVLEEEAGRDEEFELEANEEREISDEVGQESEELELDEAERESEEFELEATEEVEHEAGDEQAITEEFEQDELDLKTLKEFNRKTVEELDQETSEELENETIEELDQETVEEFVQETTEELEKEAIEELDLNTIDEFDQNAIDEREQETSEELEKETVEEHAHETIDELDQETSEELEQKTSENDVEFDEVLQESDNEPKKQLNEVEAMETSAGDFQLDTPSPEQNGDLADSNAEHISEDELPPVQAAKVPETEEVSDEELPGPKRAELPADTEVVSEDELPSVKKEANKRKLAAGDYDPGSPTSEGETPAKKATIEAGTKEEKEKEKPKKLPELDKYWKAVNDDPSDFTGWTYLLQYVDQENDMEAAREAYDAFLSHYPYCYGYWRKYADYEKRKGNKKKCEEVFERGLKAIPLSVDLWLHYLTYVKTTKLDEDDYIRSQFERAIAASGLEFRSDRLWDSYIKWETEGKRLQHVTSIYDRLFTTPTQGYTTHFENFQEHIQLNSPNKVVEVDEFLALRKEVRHMLKHEAEAVKKEKDLGDAPPGEDDGNKSISTDEETKAIRERIISIRRKIHKNTVAAVVARWNYEEGIKRPYFHVKPLERCQLKNWQEYLDYEIGQGDQVRITVLFERCLIACALYEEFWLKFVHYLEGLKDEENQQKIRDVYERACTIHHLKKPSLHLQWAMFEESVDNCNRAAEILVNLEKSVSNVLQIAYRRINLERRRNDNDKCQQLYEHYIANSKNKLVVSNISIKYARFTLRILHDLDKAVEILQNAISKDGTNPRLYLQLIDLTLQKEGANQARIVELIDSFLEKEGAEVEQKILFAQRKLEFLEDFGTDIQSVQKAYDEYQKYIKLSKDAKKKENKSDAAASKKDKASTVTSQSANYGSYGNYSGSSGQGSYPYSATSTTTPTAAATTATNQYNYPYGQTAGDQYNYQNWQYPQGGYSGYNQWGSYGGTGSGYSY